LNTEAPGDRARTEAWLVKYSNLPADGLKDCFEKVSDYQLDIQPNIFFQGNPSE